MKIKGLPGEFAFRALIQDYIRSGDSMYLDGWKLTDKYYFTKQEVVTELSRSNDYFKWPVEVYEDGSVYIPSEEELNDAHEDPK